MHIKVITLNLPTLEILMSRTSPRFAFLMVLSILSTSPYTLTCMIIPGADKRHDCPENQRVISPLVGAPQTPTTLPTVHTRSRNLFNQPENSVCVSPLSMPQTPPLHNASSTPEPPPEGPPCGTRAPVLVVSRTPSPVHRG
jgi:hypothetical protein